MALPMYIETLMNRLDTDATKDFSFPFEAQNVMIHHRSLRQVKLPLSLEHSSIITMIFDDDLENAL